MFGAVSDTSFCFNPSQYIIDDQWVESGEEFQVRLIVANKSMDFATIKIIDNDGMHNELSLLIASLQLKYACCQ